MKMLRLRKILFGTYFNEVFIQKKKKKTVELNFTQTRFTAMCAWFIRAFESWIINYHHSAPRSGKEKCQLSWSRLTRVFQIVFFLDAYNVHNFQETITQYGIILVTHTTTVVKAFLHQFAQVLLRFELW